MKRYCLLTLENKEIRDGLKSYYNKLLEFETFDLNYLKKSDWIDLVVTFLKEKNPQIIIHNYKLDDTSSDTNKIMSHNYEFTNVLSDYCFINKCKMIFLSNINENPKNLLEWTQLISERFVNQNGGVTLILDRPTKDNVSKYLHYTIENYDELEFYSHRVSTLDTKIS